MKEKIKTILTVLMAPFMGGVSGALAIVASYAVACYLSLCRECFADMSFWDWVNYYLSIGSGGFDDLVSTVLDFFSALSLAKGVDKYGFFELGKSTGVVIGITLVMVLTFVAVELLTFFMMKCAAKVSNKKNRLKIIIVYFVCTALAMFCIPFHEVKELLLPSFTYLNTNNGNIYTIIAKSKTYYISLLFILFCVFLIAAIECDDADESNELNDDAVE